MTLGALEKRIATVRPAVDPEFIHLLEMAPPQPIHNRKIYRAYMRIVEFCLEALESEELGKPLAHGLTEYVKVLATLIEEYEKKEFSPRKTSQAEVLRFLMEQNDLTQDALAGDLGGQPAVSYVLSGRRDLNAKQIAKLSERFHVSPSVFFTGP